MKQIADLTNKRLGMWTALSRSVINGRGYWLCRCECGLEKYVAAHILVSGKSKGCRSCRAKEKYESIIGKTYGELLVLSETNRETRKSRITVYKCLCSCGNITIVSRGNLLRGSVRSCGCSPWKYRVEQGAKFSVYSERISWFEEVKKDNEFILVRCAYCGKWFRPSPQQIKNRVLAVTEKRRGNNRFYCSDECKGLCHSFYKEKHFRGMEPVTSRETNSELRKIVFERDEHKCQKCGAECSLECHHIIPVSKNNMLANDPDNCITLCSVCHIVAHNIPGCRYHELRCHYENS